MTNNKNNKLSDTLEILRNSPIFNLSLSSKELFHSNFLYWLANTYPKNFGQLISSLLSLQKNNFKISGIKREQSNIDLSFTYPDDDRIFIENKVKSIAHKDQLKRYSKNLKNNQNIKLVLLSLSTPEFFEGKNKKRINGKDWFLLSYNDLSEQLAKWQLDNQYHQSLLDDYLVLVNALLQTNNVCDLKKHNLFDFHDNNSAYLQKFRQLRFHDFYLKKMYESFAFFIFKQLKTHFSDLEVIFDTKLERKDLAKKIYVHHGMTRATGLADIKYHINDDIALGIQIQGQSYKMLIESGKNYVSQDRQRLVNLAETVLDKGLWFNFRDTLADSNIIYPTGNKKFNKYGDVFRYKSVKLGSNKTIENIAELIIEDLKHVDENFDVIKKLL